MGILTQTHNGLKFTESPANISYNTTDIITIKSDGTVGIGTTSPFEKLHVNGRIYVTSNPGSDGIVLAGSGSTNNPYAYITSTNEGVQDVGMAFYVTTDAGTTNTEAIRIDDQGNVGIGTTSPADKLQVQGNLAVPAGVIYNGAAANSAGLRLSGAYFDASGYYGIRFFSSLAAVGSQTERMRITNTGNVGIGTTSPSGSLDIYGTTGNKIRIGYFTDQGADDPTLRMFYGKATRPGYSFTSDNTSGMFSGSGGGFVAFATSANERMRITSGGNVGIGTTSPAALLDVNGTFNSSGTVSGAGLRSNNIGGATTSGTGWFKIAKVDSRGGGVIKLSFTGGSYGPVTYVIKYHKDWASTTTLKLEKYGANNYITDVRFIQDDSDSKYYIEFLTASDTLSFQVYHDWTLGYNASTTMYTGALSAGAASGTTTSSLPFITYGTSTHYQHVSSALGVGTSSPLRNLHVVGNFAVNAGTGQYYGVNITGGEGTNPTVLIGDWHNASANLTWDSTNRLLRIDAQYSTSGAPIVFSGNDAAIEYARFTATGNLGIGTTSPTGHQLDIASSQGGATNSAIRALYPAGGGLANTEFGALAHRGGAWTAVYGKQGSASSAGYFDGNVGIGTARPNVKLRIVESVTNPPLAVQNTNINGYSGSWLYDSAGTLVGHWGWANGATTALSDKMYFGTIANKDVVFTTNDTEKVRITAGGNVGIGTTNTYARLSVRATSHNNGISVNRQADTTAAIYIGNDGGNNPVLAANNADMLFGRDVSGTFTERMRLTNGGNVGIGTTSPVRKLHVSTGNTDIAARFENTTSNSTVMELLTSGDGKTMYFQTDHIYVSSGSMHFGNDTGDIYLRTSTAGGVGIGTTSPSTKLDVIGDVSITVPNADTSVSLKRNVSGTVYTYGSFNNAGSDFNINGTGNVFINADSNSDSTSPDRNVTIGNRGVEYMRVRYDGNVGIGTTTPGAKLDVSGEVRSNGGFTNEDGNFTRVLSPGGAAYSGSGGVTGAFKITLPMTWSNTMMRMTVKIFDYSGGESFTIELGGYNYSANSTWYNTFAYTTCDSGTDRNFTVRFGHDGTKNCIYIGEITDAWSYPKIAVVDAQFGHSNIESYRWNDGWDIRMETTAFSSVSSTIQNTQATNWKRTGQDVYYGGGSGRVGIGTTAPTEKLDINGRLRLNYNNYGWIYALDVNHSIIMRSNRNGTENNYTNYHQYGGTLANGLGHLFWTGGTLGDQTLRMQIADDGTYFSGNVGIGTTSPVAALHVQSSSTKIFLSNTDFNTSTSTGSGLIIHTGASSGNTYGMIYAFQSGNTSYANLVVPGGNVGIGTTAPNSKLHVAGQTYMHNGASNALFIDTDVSDNNTRDAIQLYENDGQATGRQAISWYNGNQSYYKARIWTEVGNSYAATTFGIDVADDARNVSTRLAIRNGNVGIGTTAPSRKLHVFASDWDNTSGGGVIFENSNNVGASLTLKPSSSAVPQGRSGWAVYAGAGSAAIGDGNLGFWAHETNQARMVIQRAGNVGIGQTSPSYRLDVSGDIRATGDVIAYSDARVKENVETIPNALEKVKAMRGVNYNKIGEEKRSVGVIAQELLEILPEAVHQDDTGMYSVAYGNIVGVLVEAMKEQQKQIDELKEIINGLTK